jgi:hypothetical protein
MYILSKFPFLDLKTALTLLGKLIDKVLFKTQTPNKVDKDARSEQNGR